jgi:hypothetical protein
MLGVSAPQLAGGIASGIMMWIGQLTIATVDVGTLGTGTGQLPCTIPQPLLLGGIQTGFASMALVGVASPALALGISNGLAAAFPQGLIMTVHPTVGVGTATATFPGPSSVPSMIGGLRSVGMVGTQTDRLSTAIGMGLDIAFASFVIPVPIVGAATPTGGSGVGTGKLV